MKGRSILVAVALALTPVLGFWTPSVAQEAEYRISQNVMAHILNNARRGGAFARMSRR